MSLPYRYSLGMLRNQSGSSVPRSELSRKSGLMLTERVGELVHCAHEVQSKHPENMVLAQLTWAAGHSHTPVCEPSQGCRSMAPWGLQCILLLARSGRTALMWSRALGRTPAHFPVLLLPSQHILPSSSIVKKSMVPLAPTKKAAGSVLGREGRICPKC